MINIKKVASLANLKLSKKEDKLFSEQLSRVIEYVEELGKVDTKGIVPTSQVTGLESVVRDDKKSESLSVADATSGSDKIKNDYFLVPLILKNKKIK